jgi:O-antigen/teichoic acid export membrane protein
MFSDLLKTNGINIVLNLYYGPVLNAAQGISSMVKNALNSFSMNAMAATQPQIVLSYTRNDMDRLWDLLLKSSKLYFFLTFIFVLPIIFETDTVLYIWLENYPDYTVIFIRLFLVDALLITLWNPIMYANAAIGRLRTFTIIIILHRLIIFTAAIIIGINNLSPVYIYIFYLIVQFICTLISLFYVFKFQLKFSLLSYFSNVILPILRTVILSLSVPLFIHYYFTKSFSVSVISGFVSFFWCLLAVFFAGLNKSERTVIVNKLPFPIKKLFKIT